MNTNTTGEAWSFAKDFQDGNVLVRVTKTSGYRPRYSIEVGRAILPLANEGNEPSQPKVIRHFGVFVDTTLGKVEIRESIATRISRLTTEAEAWIRDVSQAREDEIIGERIEREKREADRNKMQTRQTGKTEKKRNNTRIGEK